MTDGAPRPGHGLTLGLLLDAVQFAELTSACQLAVLTGQVQIEGDTSQLVPWRRVLGAEVLGVEVAVPVEVADARVARVAH